MQAVANPLISLLGPPRTASSRLTFAQAFDSLGTTIFPFVGSILILGSLAKIEPRTLGGAGVLRYVSPGKVLASVAVGAIALILLSANSVGVMSGYALLAIGLVNSIMFPTIFTLASEGLGKRAAEGSGVIAMAIVGGAIVPPLTGLIADASSLRFALILPAICHAIIAGYGVYTRRTLA